jgi:hypothetical protein
MTLDLVHEVLQAAFGWDDYLAAFAQASGATLATLDRTMASRYPSVHVESLL